MERRYDLPQKAIDFFTDFNFFSKVMSCGLRVWRYSRALAHLCYNNEELSRRICQYCIKCRYEGTRPNWMIVLKHLFKLDDVNPETGESLQAKRLEWIFGTAQPCITEKGDTGNIEAGLASFGYNIDEQAYKYVTALNYEDQDENISALTLIMKSYCVTDMLKA